MPRRDAQGHRQRNRGPNISGTRECMPREPLSYLGKNRIMHKNLILSGKTIPLLNAFAPGRLLRALGILSRWSHVSHRLHTLLVPDSCEVSDWFMAMDSPVASVICLLQMLRQAARWPLAEFSLTPFLFYSSACAWNIPWGLGLSVLRSPCNVCH